MNDFVADVLLFAAIVLVLTVISWATGMDRGALIAGAALITAIRADTRARNVARMTGALAATTRRFVGMFSR